jgi:hypothetical protein
MVKSSAPVTFEKIRDDFRPAMSQRPSPALATHRRASGRGEVLIPTADKVGSEMLIGRRMTA